MMTAHWNYWETLFYQQFDSINKRVMGKYNPDNCYEKEQSINAQRKDFVCPCCKKNFFCLRPNSKNLNYPESIRFIRLRVT